MGANPWRRCMWQCPHDFRHASFEGGHVPDSFHKLLLARYSKIIKFCIRNASTRVPCCRKQNGSKFEEIWKETDLVSWRMRGPMCAVTSPSLTAIPRDTWYFTNPNMVSSRRSISIESHNPPMDALQYKLIFIFANHSRASEYGGLTYLWHINSSDSPQLTACPSLLWRRIVLSSRGPRIM